MNIPPSSFRQKYMARLLGALSSIDRISNKKELSLLKRRKRIKLAADISLALTSNGSLWSHALISKISKLNKDKSLLQRIIGKRTVRNMKNTQFCSGTHMQKLMAGRRRAMKRSFMKRRNMNMIKAMADIKTCPMEVRRPSPYQLARSLVSQRTKLLKRLIPGGESMDSCCLLREAADYIISLRTQVEVMQSLANNGSLQSRQSL
ncbi:hypothetical protein SUGI_0568940 [Cryptomeria japonica]|uniref:transcription factor IBH1 n=1 Tax=Cryptomeria japonica TaxID=3369 RepID=UPI002408BB98|nr:transcription factor IBH1 [Cryptomeria japonica]GLJ28865.1 hypothetical protein SUGI_0568940 [Cryptomeria japonica]